MLVKKIAKLNPTLVLLEASGDLELSVVASLAAANLPGVVVNPRQVRDFAGTTGKLAKTNSLDAMILAHLAEVIRPYPRYLPDKGTQALTTLVTWRNRVMGMLVAEKNRLYTSRPPVRQWVQLYIDWLKKELD